MSLSILCFNESIKFLYKILYSEVEMNFFTLSYISSDPWGQKLSERDDWQSFLQNIEGDKVCIISHSIGIEVSYACQAAISLFESGIDVAILWLSHIVQLSPHRYLNRYHFELDQAVRVDQAQIAYFHTILDGKSCNSIPVLTDGLLVEKYLDEDKR